MQKAESRPLSLRFSDLTACSSTTFRPLEDVVAEVVQKESELNSSVQVKPFLPKVKGDFHITAAWAEEKRKHKVSSNNSVLVFFTIVFTIQETRKEKTCSQCKRKGFTRSNQQIEPGYICRNL